MVKIDEISLEVIATYLETIDLDNSKYLEEQTESYKDGIKDGIQSTIVMLRACNEHSLVKKLIIDVYKKETEKQIAELTGNGG